MKKLMLLIAAFAFSGMQAQSFGVKGGLNVSTISNKGWDTTSSRIGFYAGGYMHAPVNQVLSIQPEILYSSVGSRYTNANTSHTRSLDYITMPIMFQFELIPSFFVEAGPQLGFMIGNKDKTTVGNKSVTISDSDSYNPFDLNVVFGAGFRVNRGISITARYFTGLTDISKNGQTTFKNDDKLRNSGFQFGIQYGL